MVGYGGYGLDQDRGQFGTLLGTAHLKPGILLTY
jgi:hypothetical protein